ncbi:MAG: hypothetical protein L6R36_001607 [Xanthoria steineri]|nr:MAG: hypothetical protein L6R36_001607 [Xanthoria steineri]
MAIEAIIQLDAASILAFWDLGCLHTNRQSVLSKKLLYPSKRDAVTRGGKSTYRNIIPPTPSIPAAVSHNPSAKPLSPTPTLFPLPPPPNNQKKREKRRKRKNILPPPRMHPPKNLLHIFSLKTSPLLHFPTAPTLQHRRARARHPRSIIANKRERKKKEKRETSHHPSPITIPFPMRDGIAHGRNAMAETFPARTVPAAALRDREIRIRHRDGETVGAGRMAVRKVGIEVADAGIERARVRRVVGRCIVDDVDGDDGGDVDGDGDFDGWIGVME